MRISICKNVQTSMLITTMTHHGDIFVRDCLAKQRLSYHKLVSDVVLYMFKSVIGAIIIECHLSSNNLCFTHYDVYYSTAHR